jgi:hypothetical protein
MSKMMLQSLHNPVLLLAGQLRIHGQGKDLRGYPFRHRKGPRCIAEPGVGLLQVEGRRIMDPGFNPGLRELPLQRLPVLDPHDIEMVHGLTIREIFGQRQGWERLEQLAVA